MYIWKSLNNLVPSLGLNWKENHISRFGPKLVVDKICGPNQRIKNLKRDSLRNFGVRLYNMLPLEVRMFKGSLENFKSLLDSYLSQCLDQPSRENLRPEAKDVYGDPSNSLLAWIK